MARVTDHRLCGGNKHMHTRRQREMIQKTNEKKSRSPCHQYQQHVVFSAGASTHRYRLPQGCIRAKLYLCRRPRSVFIAVVAVIRHLFKKWSTICYTALWGYVQPNPHSLASSQRSPLLPTGHTQDRGQHHGKLTARPAPPHGGCASR